jgi:hypothetical protein
MLWVLGIDQMLWESADGLNWQPSANSQLQVGQGPFKGDPMVVYDGRDSDPARRFKTPLLDEGFAVSADGAHWTKLDLPKIASDDEANFSYDAAERLFIHSVKRNGPHGRSVAIATSRDFQNWTDYGVVFHADDEDQELGRQTIDARYEDPALEQPHRRNREAYNVDVYNMGVFQYEGLYIGLPAMFHSTGKVPNYPNTDGFHLIHLTCSRDLKSWKRLGNRKAFIGPARIDSGAYDLTQILSPSAPVVRDDELWFYYTGLKWRGMFDYVGTYPNGKAVPIIGRNRDAGAVCLAVLRRDGFISLDAGDETGRLETRAFAIPAGRLMMNVDARLGEITVVVQDEDGKTLARSAVVASDNPRQEIQWEQGSLGAHTGRRVTLRFELKNAKLYSYWFER